LLKNVSTPNLQLPTPNVKRRLPPPLKVRRTDDASAEAGQPARSAGGC
jgi:hypothetical protein